MRILILLFFLTGCAGEGGSPTQAVTPVQQQATPPAPTPQPPTTPQPVSPPIPEIIPSPTKPNTITLAFSCRGPGPDGTVRGTFTYVIAQGPTDTNVRHLKENVVYQLEDWDLMVNSASMEDLLPSTRYRKEDQGNSVEFCLGYCVFASPPLISLTFRNGTNFILLLTFEMQDPTPMINPPSSVSEWGPLILNASMYRVPCPVCVPLALFSNGTLTMQTSQEPSA